MSDYNPKDIRLDEILTGLSEDIDLGFFMLIEYQGFDPEVTLRTLLTRGVALGKKLDQVKADLRKMVTFYVQRGTKYDRDDFDGRSKTGAGKEVRELMTAYGVKANLGGNLAPENVSVARVALLFPGIIVAYYNTGLARPIVTDPTGTVPDCYCSPGLASFMTDDEWNRMKKAYLDIMVHFTRVINRNFQTTTTGAGLVQTTPAAVSDDYLRSRAETYAEAARNSDFSKKTRALARTEAKKFEKTIRTKSAGNAALEAKLKPENKMYPL